MRGPPPETAAAWPPSSASGTERSPTVSAIPIEGAGIALRGEVWVVDLDPTRGREQRGTRPALVVSADPLNRGPAQLVVVVPLTRTNRGIPLHVRIDPPNGGVRDTSFAMCEAVRSVAKERLERRWGAVDPATMRVVDDRLRIALDL